MVAVVVRVVVAVVVLVVTVVGFETTTCPISVEGFSESLIGKTPTELN